MRGARPAAARLWWGSSVPLAPVRFLRRTAWLPTRSRRRWRRRSVVRACCPVRAAAAPRPAARATSSCARADAPARAAQPTAARRSSWRCALAAAAPGSARSSASGCGRCLLTRQRGYALPTPAPLRLTPRAARRRTPGVLAFSPRVVPRQRLCGRARKDRAQVCALDAEARQSGRHQGRRS